MASKRFSKCDFVTTSVCPCATGKRSRKLSVVASSSTWKLGARPATIWQKMQSGLRVTGPDRDPR